MATWDALADLPLQVDEYDLLPLQRDVSSAFTRQSTVIRLRGDGHEGQGEDVTYDGVTYDGHWSWIYVGRNDPTTADGTHIWQWMAAQRR